SADSADAFVVDDPHAITLSISGFINFIDPDPNDPHHVEIVDEPPAPNWGHMTLTNVSEPILGGGGPGADGQVQWTYTLDESLVRPFGIGGGRGADHFTFKIFDSHGGVVQKSVTVFISATDEAPIAQAPPLTVIDVSAGGAIGKAGTVV